MRNGDQFVCIGGYMFFILRTIGVILTSMGQNYGTAVLTIYCMASG